MAGKRKRPISSTKSSFSQPKLKTPLDRTPLPTSGIVPSPTPYGDLGIKFDNRAHESMLVEFSKLKRIVLPTRYVDDDVLSKLGLEDDVKYLFDRLGWTEFMFARDHTYERLTIEFLCSLQTEIFRGQHVETGKVAFQLMGKQFDLTLAEFNRILGLPVVVQGDRKTPAGFPVTSFWRDLTKLPYSSSGSRSSSIRNPCFCYIHRVLSQTIFGRPNSVDNVRVDELYLMYCMVKGHRVDIGAFLATHLSSVARSKSMEILVGGLITTIARKMGLSLSDLSVVKGSDRLNFNACFAMKMVEQEGARYNWLLEDKEHGTFTRLPLHSFDRTTIQDKANWLLPIADTTTQALASRSLPRSSLQITSGPPELESSLTAPSLPISVTLDLASLVQEQRRQGALIESLVSTMGSIDAKLNEVCEWQLRHDSSRPPSSG